MKKILLPWKCKHYAFWDLPCYACGCCDGWQILYCSWRINSILAIAVCRRCNTKQFLKKVCPPETDIKKNNIKLEYDTLKLLNKKIVDFSTFLFPRPYYFSVTSSALSMEYIHGISIDDRLRCARKREDIDDCLRISATWLQALHKAPLLDYCTQRIDYRTALHRLELECVPLVSKNKVVAHAFELMQHRLCSFKDLPIKLVPLHGDFKASNIICTPHGKAYGIDCALKFKNSGAMDIAQFFIDILLNRYCTKIVAKEIYLESILNVFLNAYGDNSQQQKNIIAWWLMYFLLFRWSTDLLGIKPSVLFEKSYSKILLNISELFDSSGHVEITC